MSNLDKAVKTLVVKGDLSSLSPAEKVSYYQQVCEHLGISPVTNPLQYIRLNGKLQLYTKKDATDQLRQNRGISVEIVSRSISEFGEQAVYAVVARAMLPNGRTDESIGAVNVTGLTGDQLSNAMMKAETKAKRRATLSICGLGWLDESEKDSIPGAMDEQIHHFKTPTELFEFAIQKFQLSQTDVRALLKENGHTSFRPSDSDEYVRLLMALTTKGTENERIGTDSEEANPDAEASD